MKEKCIVDIKKEIFKTHIYCIIAQFIHSNTQGTHLVLLTPTSTYLLSPIQNITTTPPEIYLKNNNIFTCISFSTDNNLPSFTYLVFLNQLHFFLFNFTFLIHVFKPKTSYISERR